ncbi:uncharacterized protein ACSSV8_003759 [Roseovarius sp. MBR-79]
MTALHPFRSPQGSHVLLVDGSRIYDVDEETYAQAAAGTVPVSLRAATAARYVDEAPYRPGGLRALSLNVAQGCNMSCSYCYADEGRFGAHARLMSVDIARMAAERFLNQVPPGQDAVLGYMGGEPFLNARVLHEVTRLAAELASQRNISLRFSVTTNGTLLRDEDITLLGDYPFSVAVSLDGGRATNDAQRLLRNGHSAYDRTVEGIRKLTTAARRPRHVSLRATVTPRSGELPGMLEDMLALGVDEAGFAPVLVSPDPRDAFDGADFQHFLAGMIDCGKRASRALLDRRRYPFSNFETALGEIHRGSHRPYPCGAAAGYASVSAEGGLFGCHRAIDDPAFAIGTIENGADREAQRDFLERRHVLRQEPCQTCWARFLCGGGCHQEVLARGRVGCDYIRGWLDFCLSAYADLSSRIPEYFDAPETFFKDQSLEPIQ